MNSDPECIFCKIVAGEIPCEKVLEDQAALAFMDIGPLAEGHVLLIPKEHYKTVEEMPAETAGAVLRHVPAIAAAARQGVSGEGLNVLQNNGAVAGQAVGHVHFHFIPRRSGDDFHFNWPAKEYPEGRMSELARAIRAALPET